MSSPKEKIGLIATEIEFSKHSIAYKVKTSNSVEVEGAIMCYPDIKKKDLLLKSNYVDPNNMEVVFTPVNVTPTFYLDVMEKRIKNPLEFCTEMDSIYAIGDTVGFIIS